MLPRSLDAESGTSAQERQSASAPVDFSRPPLSPMSDPPRRPGATALAGQDS
ncbi:hypothetical protein [Microbacterium pseudoresistens]|uniref:hypothetical protein n=1 Tax=Microbacterium pseudoresistens TaxID=640634 RepID=UPI0031F07D90